MKRLALLALTLLPAWAAALPQPAERRYDENAGLSHAHATQILQDHQGMVWIATWNGLNRFDGYDFTSLKPAPGDGCSMTSDRLRDIWEAPGGDIYCLTDEGVFRFSTTDYRFHDLAPGEADAALSARHGDGRGRFDGSHIAFTDRQGNQWRLSSGGVGCQPPLRQPGTRQVFAPAAEVKSLFLDQRQRCWVGTGQDAALRLYDRSGQPLGYLGADGRLHAQPVAFAAPVYCMAQSRSTGTLWLGSKPSGLFRLRERPDGSYELTHVDAQHLHNVYHILEDARGRLWLAMLGGGVACLEEPEAEAPLATQLRRYPADVARKARFLHLTADGTLLVATTDGLLVGRVPAEGSPADMAFTRHAKEPRRAASLGCSAVMDIQAAADGSLYVSTETGGVSRIASTDLLAPRLDFVRFDRTNALPTDVVQSLSPMGDSLLVVSSHQLALLNPRQPTGASLGAHFFGFTPRFSEAHPVRLPDGRWLFGLHDGLLAVAPGELRPSSYVPPIALTSIAVKGRPVDLAANRLDTLLLRPDGRSLTISFAALDYSSAELIGYAYRMADDDPWTVIGRQRSVTLLDLRPGTYRLALRSTNADGQWVDNVRTLTIVAQPRFAETLLAQALLVLLCVAVVAAVAYTVAYIRRIKRQQRDTLQKYLALLHTSAEPVAAAPPAAPEPAPDREVPPFMQRVVAFVEQNIGNADVGVADMAEAAAVSRSGLQRKMKQLMGVTPVDFLREARIKRASQLLLSTDATVADVAYQCGFSDPKYFSRCFKQSTGKSPSEYKAS